MDIHWASYKTGPIDHTLVIKPCILNESTKLSTMTIAIFSDATGQEEKVYVCDFANPDLVTVIRREVRYDEVVMTRKEFNELNKKLRRGCDNEDEYWKTIEELDSSMKDVYYVDDVVQHFYTATLGDITPGTDDVLFCRQFKWTEDENMMGKGIKLYKKTSDDLCSSI